MYNLYCEHPVIIRHPRLKDLLPVFGSYRTPNGLYDLTPSQCHTWKYRFPEWLFSARKSGFIPAAARRARYAAGEL